MKAYEAVLAEKYSQWAESDYSLLFSGNKLESGIPNSVFSSQPPPPPPSRRQMPQKLFLGLDP